VKFWYTRVVTYKILYPNVLLVSQYPFAIPDETKHSKHVTKNKQSQELRAYLKERLCWLLAVQTQQFIFASSNFRKGSNKLILMYVKINRTHNRILVDHFFLF